MEEKKELPRVRMKGYEQSALLDWMAVLTVLKNEALDKRLEMIPYGKRDRGLINSTLLRITERIVDTVPADQLVKIHKQLPHVRIYTGTKIPRDMYEKQYGLFMTFEELTVLTERAHETCLGCMLDRHEAKRCPLRTIYDGLDLDLNALRNRSDYDHECPYRGF